METLCDPQNDKTIFFVISGKIIQIEMTSIYNKLKSELRSIKKSNKFQKSNEDEFVSNFPDEKIWKTDYKVLYKGDIFGNSKILTLKKFRPTFCIGYGYETKVLSFPVSQAEIAIKKISNMGENKEKNAFFENFDQYRDYSFH